MPAHTSVVLLSSSPPSSSRQQLTTMSNREIDRTSASDPEQEEVVGREDAEVEVPRVAGDGPEHRQIPAAREVQLDEEKKDQAAATAPPTSANVANVKKVFGMKRSNPTVKKGNDVYDQEQVYPEDAIYAETTPNARVWKTYEDESKSHDANMVGQAGDSADGLLVFAGLFSGVVTTFVAQSSQSLQPDYAAMSTSLLYESVLLQRAIANGSSVNTITPSPLNPTIAFVPATTDIWWLYLYVNIPSGTARDRSFTRQFRYAGFQKWRVGVFIGLPPVLMHLALAMFLVGLVIFLHPVQALSWIIGAGTILVYTAYAAATILPILFPQCPYRTPLCDLVYKSFCHITPRVTWNYKERFLSACRQGKLGSMFHYLPRVQARIPHPLWMIESKFVQQLSTKLAAEALYWLLNVSTKPTVQSIVMQSIGGLPMASEEMFLAFGGDTEAVDTLWYPLFKQCTQLDSEDSYYELLPGLERKLERLLRFYPRKAGLGSINVITLDTDSFELAVAILSNGYRLSNGETESISPGEFFIDIIHSSKLPPRCWYHLMIQSQDVLSPLDPDNDDHTNLFPLHLCSAFLCSFRISQYGLTQDFDSSFSSQIHL
ncbi:hypothetical protein ARMGADRAFT_677560 [Armillaria gallica]|uniref:DUF6535 domain-containing protein n=1 Tax=Armillaria gallica TaxID=47427 RepID=A0A2H3CNV4_ARMGA|nr:hypothetical protein ARMGADRAFT_677560 [Armillaria gallica]